MSTLFIFLFLLLTVLLGCSRYKKLGLFVGMITLVSFITIGNGLIPTYLLYLLQTYTRPDTLAWEKYNTIVVLGAGTSKTPGTHEAMPSLLSYSRISMAVELYRDCKTKPRYCHIVISGGDPLHHGKTEAAVYQDVFLKLGVQSTDIQLEPHSKNTFQNAEFTSALLMQHPKQKILLISSNLALKRALIYFAYFNVHPLPIPSDFITVPFSKFPLGYNLAISDIAMHEIVGIIRFYVDKAFACQK